MGDFNVKVGKHWETWKDALRKFRYAEKKESGQRLLHFCLSNNLRVANIELPAGTKEDIDMESNRRKIEKHNRLHHSKL